MNFKELAQQTESYIIERRRYYHQHPELSEAEASVRMNTEFRPRCRIRPANGWILQERQDSALPGSGSRVLSLLMQAILRSLNSG